MSVTVVIASYKYGHLAPHCIESVLSQTKKPDKILFVDDAAGDCSHLPSMYKNIEFVLREKNLGTVDNFHDMLMRVKTEYVMFIGADNWFRSDAIELVTKEKADIVTYDIIVTGELKREITKRHPNEITSYQGDYYWKLERHNGSMLYRTKLGQAAGYKRMGSGPHTQEDMFIFNKMKERGASIVHVNQGLLYYRRHAKNFLKY